MQDSPDRQNEETATDTLDKRPVDVINTTENRGLCCWNSMWKNQQTPRSTVLLEKLTVTNLIKKFPAIYGALRFTTVFTTTRHWSLSWDRWTQYALFHSISLWSVVILSSHIKVKVKLSLCLTKYHAMKAYWGSGRIAPRIDLGTRWRWVVSFTPRPLYSQGKEPLVPIG
jgi:hypothetical protein